MAKEGRPACASRFREAENFSELYVSLLKSHLENPFLWTGMKDALLKAEKMWYMKLP